MLRETAELERVEAIKERLNGDEPAMNLLGLMVEKWPAAVFSRTSLKRKSVATSECHARALIVERETSNDQVIKTLTGQFPGVREASMLQGIRTLRATYSEVGPEGELFSQTKTLVVCGAQDTADQPEAEKAAAILARAADIVQAVREEPELDISVPETSLYLWRKALEINSRGLNLKVKVCTRRAGPKSASAPMINHGAGEVITVRGGEGLSYADLVKSIGKQLEDVEINVTRVDKMENGVAQLRITGPPNTASRIGAILESRIPGAEIDTSGRKRLLRSSLLAPGTTKEEILKGIEEALGRKPKAITITSIRPAYGESLRANIHIPMGDAEELKKKERFRIGLVTGWFTEPPKRCRRCLEIGHLAGQCAGPDRSKMCLRCHGEGHMARDCRTERVNRRNATKSSPAKL